MKWSGPRETRFPGGAPGDWADLAACVGDPRFGEPARSDLADLAGICSGCPVLPDCRDYASRHLWTSVFVAGWVAPAHPRRPPWARSSGE